MARADLGQATCAVFHGAATAMFAPRGTSGIVGRGHQGRRFAPWRDELLVSEATVDAAGTPAPPNSCSVSIRLILPTP